MAFPFYSIVITGKNVSHTIKECLDSIFDLDYPTNKFEVIYVDALSTDNTLELVSEYLKLWDNFFIYEKKSLPGGGRNYGISNASGEIIAFTDADCSVPRNWLNAMNQVFQEHPKVVGVGGPNITPSSITGMTKYLGGVMESGFGAASTRNLSQKKGVFYVSHNPPCNSALFRWIFTDVGLFNEQYPVTEDVELDYRIVKNGFLLLYSSDIWVYHNRRSTFNSFIKQMFRYGYWRAFNGLNNKIDISFIHIIPALFSLYVFTLIIIPRFFSLYIIPLLLYFFLSLVFAAITTIKSHDICYLLLYLPLVFTEHLSYGFGFIIGALDSLRGKKTENCNN